MNRRTATNVVITAAGIALLLLLIRNVGGDVADPFQAGIQKIRDGLASVGAGFVVVLLLSFLRFVVRSYAWMTLNRTPASLGRAIAATISGDALGNTPLGLVASEPAKAIYLAGTKDSQPALASLTAENFFYSISTAIYVMCGFAALLLDFQISDIARWMVIVVLASMAVVLATAGWVAWQKPAAASAILERVPSRRLSAVVQRVRDFETQTYGSAGHEGGRLGVVAISEVTFHLLSLAECWLTLWLISGSMSITKALVFDGAGRLANIVFKMIPLRAGGDELLAIFSGQAMGFRADIGLVLALVRKVRMVVWAAAGLALWTKRR